MAAGRPRCPAASRSEPRATARAGLRPAPVTTNRSSFASVTSLQSRHEVAVHDRELRIRILDDVLEHAPAIRGVDRDVHRAEVIERVVREQHLGRVRLPAQHVLALLHAGPLQAGRDRDHLLAQLTVRPAPAAVEDHVRLVGALGGPAVDEIADDATLARRNARISVASGWCGRRARHELPPSNECSCSARQATFGSGSTLLRSLRCFPLVILCTPSVTSIQSSAQGLFPAFSRSRPCTRR